MAKVPITVMGFRCDRCSHEWVPRESERESKVCPKCKSAWWNVPRQRSEMTYEVFRGKVKGVLASAGQPMTWTEVRTRAGLPQLFPNNQWVRHMEADIGLARDKDKSGIIRWRLG